MEEELLTYAATSEALSVSRATLYRMIGDGILTPVTVPRPSGRGTVPRIRAAEVRAALKDRMMADMGRSKRTRT